MTPQTTTLSLGSTPVSIGGGDNHVWLKGLPPKAFLLWTERGKVLCKDQQTGNQNELKDGSTFTVAGVEFRIAAASPIPPHAQLPPTSIHQGTDLTLRPIPPTNPSELDPAHPHSYDSLYGRSRSQISYNHRGWPSMGVFCWLRYLERSRILDRVSRPIRGLRSTP